MVSSQALSWARQREYARKLKDVPCRDCGGCYPEYVMEFDHTRGIKSGNVMVMASRVGRASLDAEIAKCDVVCANCHKVRTYNRR
jgi:hypothetical protein